MFRVKKKVTNKLVNIKQNSKDETNKSVLISLSEKSSSHIIDNSSNNSNDRVWL